jgi:phosphate/sulfate permease
MRMIRLLIGKLGTRRHVRLPIAGTHHNFRTRWNRSALAMVAVAVACGSYVLGASVTPSASGDIGNQLEFSRARGFDACELPKISNTSINTLKNLLEIEVETTKTNTSGSMSGA